MTDAEQKLNPWHWVANGAAGLAVLVDRVAACGAPASNDDLQIIENAAETILRLVKEQRCKSQ